MAEQEKKVSFKHTLNLNQTDFPIHPKFKDEEEGLLLRWAHEKLEQKTFEKNNEKNARFILHDGPPYANGHIHLGHAYNKSIKDIIAKSQRMAGNHVPVVPGFDCHGLPIEQKVTQELGKQKTGPVTRAELIKKCRDFAQGWIEVQTAEFRRLGVLMDFDHPYKTMDPHYEASIIRAFGDFVEKGYIERKLKTVPWCMFDQTVLAAAEIEHQPRIDPSIYVLFTLNPQLVVEKLPDLARKLWDGLADHSLIERRQSEELAQKRKPVSFLVWTTTPWTLPLNRAVFLNPTATYAVLHIHNQYVIIGESLADTFCAQMKVAKELVATLSADQLVGLSVAHPFIDNVTVPVLADSFVSLEDGTACVHSAPGCGPEDYEMGVKYGLEIFSPVGPDGRYTAGIQPAHLLNMKITEGQTWVLEELERRGTLLYKTEINHPYPHCWRCRKPLIFRATQQWFCNLEKHHLRERALKAIDSVAFFPERSGNFLRATIGSRLEWCLSRQRIWGVPIPALLCKNGDSAFIEPALIDKVAAGIEEHGIEWWDTVTADELLSKKKPPTCTECGSTEFVKETDILDVWFESGISHFAVLQRHDDRIEKKEYREAAVLHQPISSMAHGESWFPADLYVEGVDQHRAWFQSSLLTSLVLENEPCFKGVLTHGFTVDAQGRKMSKSLGNVVAPEEMIKEMGTDCLRLWASSISLEGDAVVSEALLNNVKEVYRKIRNTCRFLLANLYDYDHEKDAIALDKLRLLDRIALHELHLFAERIRAAYDSYDLTIIFHELGSFCAQLSSVYVDIIKDRLYVELPSGHARRSAQTVCWYHLDQITRLMAPILSFTAELISDHYQKGKQESIHLQDFVDVPLPPGIVAEQWNLLADIRPAILKAIESLRATGVIKHSLEAQVTLFVDTNADTMAAWHGFERALHASHETKEAFIKEWLIVSRVTFAASKDGLAPTALPGLYVQVTPAEGHKCPRCWQYDTNTNEFGLCSRCAPIVQQIESGLR